MAITMRVTEGSGRGTCSKCRQIIKKGEKQVVATGYQDSSRCHLNCLVPEKKVIITIRGGMAEVFEASDGVEVEIRDYDIEGGTVDEEYLKTDAEGHRYWKAH